MISTIFIGDLEAELEQKTAEREMLVDQLALLDVQIDKYDTVIENMDKSVLPLLNEINVAISSVKTAYDNRIAIGCKSNLYWKLISSNTQNSRTFPYATYTYQCTKNSSVEIDYGYWGAKYYRRPQNQDYGANIVKSFTGSITGLSTNLAVVSVGSTIGVLVGDLIVDNINNPVIFSPSNLPKVVAYGTSTLQVNTVSIAGSISVGSTTLISLVGLGTTVATSGLTTVGIDTGSSVVLSGVIAYGTTVVGVGTTYAYKTVWDTTSGSYISSAFSTNTLRLSLPAIGSTTTGPFSVGINSTFPSFLLSTSAGQSVSNGDFTVIRNTQSTVTEFDYSNNPIDPVTIGIMSTSSIGYGHTLVRVNNTASTSGPVQWHEVYGADIEPEPAVGAGYAAYYSGNTSWPVYRTINRTGVGTVTGYGTPTYATEGTIVETGFETTFPVSGGYFLPSVGIDTATVSSQNPSAGTCSAADAAITAAEASRDAIIAKYQTQIDNTINASKTLRRLRDKLETKAFAYLQARTNTDAEINTIKQNLISIRNTDFTPYEPPTNLYSPAYRYSSSTVGFASTGT
jgi:hypothetical protein